MLCLSRSNKLFKIEEALKDLSPEERKEQRFIQAKPVLEAYWAWVDSNINKVLPKSKIGKALQYSQNQQEA